MWGYIRHTWETSLWLLSAYAGQILRKQNIDGARSQYMKV